MRKKISDTSKTCIHCGYKLNNNSSFSKIVLIVIVIIALVIILFAIKNNTNEEELPYCHDEEFFYKQVKDVIHDEYWEYDIKNVYCNGIILDGEIDVSCGFEYKKKEWNNYNQKGISKTFKCSHTK